MIQLYAHIDDLTPNEEYVKEEVDAIIQSIKEEGILQQLNVTPEGLIIKGNTRYHAGIELELKYLPVRSDLASGLITDKPTLPLHLYTSKAAALRPIKEQWDKRLPVTSKPR